MVAWWSVGIVLVATLAAVLVAIGPYQRDDEPTDDHAPWRPVTQRLPTPAELARPADHGALLEAYGALYAEADTRTRDRALARLRRGTREFT